jgi:uncharacterized membrane protein YdjX (TVP38/TMEM64 family)
VCDTQISTNTNDSRDEGHGGIGVAGFVTAAIAGIALYSYVHAKETPTPKPVHTAPAVAHAGAPWGLVVGVVVGVVAVTATLVVAWVVRRLLVARATRRLEKSHREFIEAQLRRRAERPVRALPAAQVKAQDFVDGKVDVR